MTGKANHPVRTTGMYLSHPVRRMREDPAADEDVG